MKNEPKGTENDSRRAFVRGAGLVGGGLLASALVGGAEPAAAQAQTSNSAGDAANARAKLRRLIQARKLFPTPVIHDALSAKLSEYHGFECVFAGGYPISYATYGIGDYGMITITELIEFASRIQGMLNIPVIADADDLGGNPLNVYRSVQRYEFGGVGGLMMEDMFGAKHVPGVREGLMYSTEGMVDRIKAALDARKDKDFVILVRTDALSAKEPAQKMEERIMAYTQAGADALFVAGGSLQEVPRLTKMTNKPFMAVTTNVPLAEQVKNEVVLGSISVPLVGLAAGAVHKALGELKKTGIIEEMKERSLPSDVMAALLRSAEAAEIAKKYNAFRL